MGLDPPKGGFEPVDQESADYKGDAKSQRIAKKHQDAPNGGSLLGGKHQGGTEEGADTGGPSNGKNDSEKQGGEEAGFFYGKILPIGFVQRIDPDPSQKIEPKDDYDEPGDKIDNRAVALQNESEAAGKGTESHKHKSKSADKAKGIYQSCFF